MPDETLLTAARRVVRDFNIDMNKGGLITEDTQKSVETLDKMVRQVDANNAAYRVVPIRDGQRPTEAQAPRDTSE